SGGGNGVGGTVNALAVSGSELYVGGNFTMANIGAPITANRIARWNGSAWSALGSGGGNGVGGTVNALAVSGNKLYLGGHFTHANIGAPITANRIARWDGSTWSALGTGAQAPVFALALTNSETLYVGGEFLQAGNKPSSRIGRYTTRGTLNVALPGTGTGTVSSDPVGLNCPVECSETFAWDQPIILTATADPGSVFIGWSGGSCSGTELCVIDFDQDTSVTAEFELLTYTIGGTVSGLALDNNVVLRNNDTDDLTVSENESFTFSTALPDGSAYLVTVHTQPTDPNQTCVVANEAGNLAGANVTNVDVTCTTDTYVVTTTATNGIITSTIDPVIEHGQTATVTGEASDNHFFASVSGCNGIPQGNSDQSVIDFSYETGPIVEDCTIEAVFAIRTYPVTATNSGNGSITPSSQTVDHGSSAGFIVTPAANHHVVSVLGDNCTPEDQGGGTWTAINITQACAVTATFAIDSYTVTTMATNGTITSTENPLVDHGQTTTVTGDADDNHYFAVASGCGGTEQTNTDQSVTGFSYETGPITEACTVEAIFAIRTYTVTTTATYGTITSTENPVIDHGQTTTVTGEADDNHYFASVSGCGGMEQSNTDQSVTDFTYETGPITEACSVGAVFATLTYTVSVAEIQGEGTVDVLTPVVDHDDDAEFEVTPDAGWLLASFSGDTCTPADNGDGTWTASNITADCAVTAVFVENTTTGIRVSRHPAIINEAVTYTIIVTGTATAPPDGQVDLVSDMDGSICSLTTADSTSGNTATFTCQHTWNEPGSHVLTANFSGSATHGDSHDELTQQIVSDEFIFWDRLESN
ncbi:MAG: Ig-like domain repeat protein, partial [Wenzhouxiangella sp.]|nr:Ig-like domain repeat protein [Wenzhouxiangella sp.]